MRSSLSLSPTPHSLNDTIQSYFPIQTPYITENELLEAFMLNLPEHTQQNLKLPPIIEKRKRKLISNEKINLFIDLGLSPKARLAHEDLIKFKQAKKKSITITDFMRKSVKQKILSSHKLTNIFESEKNDTKSQTNQKDRSKNVAYAIGFMSKNKNSASSQQFSLVENAESESSAGFKKNYNKEDGLKKIEKILESCDTLLRPSKSQCFKVKVPNVKMRKSL